MATHEVIEIIGSLVSGLKAYASKLPTISPFTVASSSIKPSPEAVTAYEQAVLRFRQHTGTATFRGVNDLLLESLEAFEGGRLLGAVQPVLMGLDHLEVMVHEKTLTLPQPELKRLQEYRGALNRILPGNQPELEGAGRGL